MTLDIKNSIEKIEHLAHCDKESAIALANELVDQNPNESEAWALRAFLRGLKKLYQDSIIDITHAIELDPKPIFFYARGRYKFKFAYNSSSPKDFLSSADDFIHCLKIENYGDDSFRQTLHFWCAEALLKSGKKKDALSHLTPVPEDFRMGTYQLRTKSDLLADCEKMPNEE